MEELITNLNNCDRNEPESLLEIIKQINSYYVNLTDYRKIDQDLAFSFPQPSENRDEPAGGILEYVKFQIALKPHDSCREQCFQLMSWLIDNDRIPREVILQYIVRIKDNADLVWRNQRERSKVQNAALEVLLKLFKKFGSNFKSYELDASQLYYAVLPNSELSAFQPTVRGQMFHLCGILPALFPDFMTERRLYIQLLVHLVTYLKAEVSSKDRHLEVAILFGTIRGLDSFLVSFKTKLLNIELAPEKENIGILYDLLTQIVNPECSIAHNSKDTPKIKRRDFQRAGLELVANHCQLFEKKLVQHYETWFNDLLIWVKSNNIDDHRVGLKAMFAFLECISSFFYKPNTETDERKGEPSDVTEQQSTLVKFFLERFRFILDNNDSQGREIIIAVKGYGLLSKICNDDTAEDILFSRIVKRVETLLGEMDAPVVGREKFSKYGSVSLLPLYVESIGHILFSMKISDEESLAIFHNRLLVIEELAIALATHFPQLGEKYKESASYAMDRVLSSLYLRHFKWCRPYLEKVIEEGVTFAIASPTRAEVDMLSESYSKVGNEKELKKLNLHTVKSYVKFWTKLVNSKRKPGTNEVAILVYDSLIQWILGTIGKLDLSLEFIDSDGDFDGCLGVTEEVPVDPIYNTKAKTARDFHLFINLVEFLETFVLDTNLKLFEKWVGIILVDMINYVKKFPLVSGFYKIIGFIFEVIRKTHYFENDRQLNDDSRRHLVELCSQFMNGLTSKLDEFRDDLLMSILNVWLAAPEEIIVNHVIQLENTMKVILRAGRTFFPLAERGIFSLGRWLEYEKIDIINKETLFQSLFPILKTYFTSVGREEESNTAKSRNSGAGLASLANSNIFRKSKTQSFQKRLKEISIEKESLTITELQLLILKLFGSQAHLLNLDACNEFEVSMNIEERFLKYSVPFQDIKPDIYLEKLLPRITELCRQATQRQLRTASSECLHSIILYFLGYSVHSTSSSDHSELFIKLCSTMMILGCDADTVIRQLFNPLAIQVVHWFTRTDAKNYGDIVLRIIADNLTQTEDTPLRDFSAVCLSEFFSWSVKHSNTPKVKQVMKTLCAMATHSAVKYRQGSVIAFNSIYREFRENDKLVDTYTFLLIHSYISSLCLNMSDLSSDSILVNSTCQAVTHLERIVIKKKDKFNTDIRDRIRPVEFDGPCLKHLVIWLLKKSGSSSTAIGQQTGLELFRKLAPLIRGLGSAEQLLLEYEKLHGENGIVQICEPNLETQDATDIEKTIKAVTAATEMYLSLAPYYSIAKLLKLAESKLLEEISQLLNCSDQSYFSKFPSFISSICQLMNFASNCFTLDALKSFTKLSLLASKLMINNNSHQVLGIIDQLWETLSKFNLEKEFKQEVKQILMSSELFESIKTDQNVAENNSVVQWLTEIARGSHLINILNSQEKQKIINDVWNFTQSSLYSLNTEKGKSIWTSPHINFRKQELLQNLMILAFELGLRKNVIFAVFDSTPVVCTELKSRAKMTKGEIFQQIFLPVFCFNEELINFEFLQAKTKLEKVGFLLETILSCLKGNKKLRKRFGAQVVSSALKIWQQLSLNCEPEIVARIVSGLTALDLDLCRNSNELCSWWSGPSVIGNPNLTLKEKSEFIHFAPLFGLSSNLTVVDECINALEVMVNQSIKVVPNRNWFDDELPIVKVFFKLLNLYESVPENMKLLSVLVRYIGKSSAMIEAYNISVEEDKNSNEKESGVKNPKNISGVEMSSRLRNLIPSSTNAHQVKIAETILNTIFDYEECRTNLATNKFCLLPAVGALSNEASKTYFIRNIFKVIQQIEIPSNISLPAWNAKTVAMSQIEMLALKTPSDFIKGDALSDSYYQQLYEATKKDEDKKLFQKLMKVSQGFRQTQIPAQRDGKLRSANFNFNAASFNASVALCKATSLSLRHFTGFVFVEKVNNDNIWSNIINSSIQYKFPVVMDIQNETKVFRGKVIETKNISSVKTVNMNEIFEGNNRAVVAESSLAHDASRFDFTTSVKVASSPFYQKVFAGVNPYKTQTKAVEFATAAEESLEWSVVNEHDCMFAFISAVNQMESLKTEEDLPAWAKEVKSLLDKRSTNSNIKAFFLGGIMNCSDVFKQYAKHFLDVIINAILSNCFPTSESADDLDDKGAPKLNHFVKEIVIMLLSWPDVVKPSSGQVKRILEHIMTCAWHKRNDIMEHNLQLFQAIVNHWVKNSEPEQSGNYDQNAVPFQLISQALQMQDLKLGLLLTKYLCQSQILPCHWDDVANLVDALSNSLRSTSKTIYTLGGEVTGLVFSILDSRNYPNLDKALKRMKSKLDKESSRPQAYLSILSNIGKSYAPFMVPLKSSITSFLKNPLFRDQALNILVNIQKHEISAVSTNQMERNQLIQNLFADLDGRRIFSVELKNEFNSGIEILEILANSDIADKEGKIGRLMIWTQEAEFCSNQPTRLRYASLVSSIYTKFGGHREKSDISNKAEKIFIRLLKDEDNEVRKLAEEFWANNLRSWSKTPSLLLEVIEILGDNPKAITTCLELMMKRCSSSPDFSKLIFDKDLGDCTFSHYDINTSWKTQTLMQPLFAESLSSSQNLSLFPKPFQDSILSQRNGTQFGMNLLRATLKNLQYTQTQEGQKSSIVDSLAEPEPMEIDFDFDFDMDQPFAVPNVTEQSPTTANPLDLLRKRFFERSDSSVYAAKEIQRQQTLINSEIENIRAKRSGVKLTRRYRIGELPDIAIKNSELLANICSVAENDEEMGKAMLVILVSAFVHEMDPETVKVFKHNAGITVNTLFKDYGSEINPQLAAALIEICIVIDVPINVNLVSDISKRFGFEKLGILQAEQCLANEGDCVVPSKRPKLVEEPNQVNLWQLLGELYKQIDDLDSVRNTFLHVRNHTCENSQKQLLCDKARQALYFESMSKYVDAQKCYQEILNQESVANENEVDQSFLQFAEDALHQVMASLSDWDGLFTRCHEYWNIHKEELNTVAYRDRVLPIQITSGVQSYLRRMIDPEFEEVDFQGFIEALTVDEEWKSVMEQFPMDFATIHFLKTDVSKSQSLLEIGYSASLNSFQSFERLAKKRRKECFLELQKASAVYDTLDCMKAFISGTTNDNSGSKIYDKTSSLIQKWQRATNCTQIPLINADIIVTQKLAFLNIIQEKLKLRVIDDKDELIDDIERLQFDQDLFVVKLACLTGNSYVGNYYLALANHVSKECDEKVRLQWRSSLIKLLTRCESSYSIKDWVKQWTSSWKKLVKLESWSQENKDLVPLIWEIQGDLLKSLIKKESKDQNNLTTKKCTEQLCDAFQLSSETLRNRNSLMVKVFDCSVDLISEATFNGNDEEPNQSLISTSEAAAMKFYDLIKAILDRFPEKRQSEVIHEQLLLCLFNAMKKGNKLAIQMFPTCFGVLERFPNLITTLSGEVNNVPSWILLPWLDQIITYYKQRNALTPFLKPIIERLLRDFPQAFHVQYSDLDLIQKKSTLQMLFASFREALKALVLPDILFRNIGSFRGKITLNEFKRCVEQLMKQLEGIRTAPQFYGRIHQEYIDEIYPKLQEKHVVLCGLSSIEDATSLSETLESIQKDIREIFNPEKSPSLLKNIFNRRQGSKEYKSILDLKDLSPWLSKYHFSNFKDGLEIPGLYATFNKPENNYHPNIIAFEPTVKIYQSNTRPIGLTMIANSGQRYSYLMKCGDDLRQDKRIQHLLSVFNEVLASDLRCRERELKLLTYSVIPISKHFGMIELVRKTISLRAFTLNSLRHRDSYNNSFNYYKKYEEYVVKSNKAKNDDNGIEPYGEIAGKSRKDAETLFDKVASYIPKTLFRDNVRQSADSLHSYFQLREKLTRSYGTMCIIHYLLGIGDRHLENTLIKLDVGQFLGIDFGHAFGSATADLHVPELVPFRLTPQFQNFLSPYGATGLFKETMLHTWRAIIKSSELISTITEIFIAEPTVD